MATHGKTGTPGDDVPREGLGEKGLTSMKSLFWFRHYFTGRATIASGGANPRKIV
jgi:hypothetical protein